MEKSPVRATCTLPDVAELLGISRSSAYLAAARGEIPVLTIGRRKLVPLAALEALLRQPGGTSESDPPALVTRD